MVNSEQPSNQAPVSAGAPESQEEILVGRVDAGIPPDEGDEHPEPLEDSLSNAEVEMALSHDTDTDCE